MDHRPRVAAARPPFADVGRRYHVRDICRVAMACARIEARRELVRLHGKSLRCSPYITSHASTGRWSVRLWHEEERDAEVR
jgi:hypothetical protein